MRDFAIGERLRLQVRGEFFNAPNHTNLSPPSVAFDTMSFGVINSSGSPRLIQIGARLVY
jgi:hypothetical protein